jgi:hypothetical protein
VGYSTPASQVKIKAADDDDSGFDSPLAYSLLILNLKKKSKQVGCGGGELDLRIVLLYILRRFRMQEGVAEQ